LYHLYTDSLSTKIGTLQENQLIPIYVFKNKIQPFHLPYDTRNRILNNTYQTIQFSTENPNIYGIIEVDDKRVNVVTFENTYRERDYGDQYIKKWVEKYFDFYFSNFDNLHL